MRALRNAGFIGPVVAAAIGSSILTFVTLILIGRVGLPTGPNVLMDIAIFLSILLFWAPAFAFIPATILGFLVERPLSRRLIARGTGGFFEHLAIVVGAAVLLWLLLRIVVVATGPQTRIVDHESLAVFAIVGLCSALSWWFSVVVPARRS